MPDSPSRVERLLNVIALLLETRRPLTRGEIVREVAGYPPDRSASRRAFERDKDTLRGMGVPVTVVPVGDGSESGYLVKPRDYYLPDLGLEPDETAALRVAVSAIALGDRSGEGALMKLGDLGDEARAPIASLPMVPALASLFEAFRKRAVVTFRHRGTVRTLEVWGLSSKRGHWYAVGQDRDRQEVRSFRADRIEGDVEVGEPDAFVVPDDFRPDDHVHDRPWLFGSAPTTTVRILVDAGHTAGMVAHLGEEAVVERRDDGSAIVELPVVDHAALRTFVLGFLEHAEILDPPEVRDEIVAWLDRIAVAQP